MPERLASFDNKPPKRWHEAIRGFFPGNLVDKNIFITMPEQSEGFVYSILSLTANDPGTKFSEGIYIFTNIPNATQEAETQYMLPLLKKIKTLIDREQAEEEKVIIPAEIDPELAKMGIWFDLANSVGIRVIGSSKSGIIYSLEKIDISHLKGLKPLKDF